MSRKQKTIHYLYKTTCLVTGRYYIGMHSTNNLDDGYMGSGKRLRYSLRTHGVDNHVKEILEFFESRELLIEAEIKAITPDMITDDNCMNLTEGGSGGHGARFLTKEQLSKGGKVSGDIIKKRIENDEDFKLKYQLNLISIVNKACEEGKYSKNKFRKEKHSEETKQKMRKSKNVGSTNSQFGTCWITKEETNKKIKKEDLETYLNEGWVKGRR